MPVNFELHSLVADSEPDLNNIYVGRLGDLGQVQTFTSDELLYRQGEKAHSIYILKSGMAKSICTDEYGHEALLKSHEPVTLLGLSALRPKAIRDASAIALGKVETIRLGREAFLRYMQSDGGLGILLVRLLLKRQQHLHARISNMIGRNVEQRLAGILLQRHDAVAAQTPPGKEIIVRMTHEELAAFVLSRRQYVTAILRRFVVRGLIENQRRRIRIIQPKGLGDIFLGA